jgi:hypothetical protein
MQHNTLQIFCIKCNNLPAKLSAGLKTAHSDYLATNKINYTKHLIAMQNYSQFRYSSNRTSLCLTSSVFLLLLQKHNYKVPGNIFERCKVEINTMYINYKNLNCNIGR